MINKFGLIYFWGKSYKTLKLVNNPIFLTHIKVIYMYTLVDSYKLIYSRLLTPSYKVNNWS